MSYQEFLIRIFLCFIISFCIGNQPYCLLNIKKQQRRKTVNRFKYFNLDGNRTEQR